MTEQNQLVKLFGWSSCSIDTPECRAQVAKEKMEKEAKK